MTARMNRRLYGLLSKRLDEAQLDEIQDPRDARGKRWQLSTLLRAVLGGLLAGARSLADVETQSERLSSPCDDCLEFGDGLPTPRSGMHCAP